MAPAREMSQNYFFGLTGSLTDLHQTLHTTSVDPPDKNLSKVFWYSKQKLLKLLNTNFLYILYKTGNVAYLHIAVSEWHKTHVTTSPWAPKVLRKILGDDH